MYRTKIEELKAWKQQPDRKPLIVQGARQVGKTWLIKELGRTEFQKMAYVNFEYAVELQNLFLQDLNITRIISLLGAFSGIKITPEDTLIVFDEIQSAEKGLTSLKYFCENAPEYHVIASDSLLGMNLHNKVSFPVGKVNFLYLYPMNFYEFLLALHENGLAEILRTKQWDILGVFTNKFKEYLRYYFYIGGMPEAVQAFANNRDWRMVRRIQHELLKTYENDFSKHAPYDVVPRINMIWQSIPAQLGRENKKFVYGVMKEGARAKDFELAMQWLTDSGILLKCCRISKPDMPLVAYQDLSAFKLFFNDTGLLAAKSNLDVKTIIGGTDIFTEFKGALTEQFVMQQLRQAEPDYIGYWTNDKSTTEVDFVVQHNGEIIPVEVKATENLTAKSFKFFCEKFKPANAVRTSLSGYRRETWMTNVPLYAIGNYF
ncbi:MAG: ATP-binding protein [Prevotellaceae bacterium]|jgi:predicted AAA+ superfamily ATPase|nr:ATP-binding protein [Prevotellaceae bacterium]